MGSEGEENRGDGGGRGVVERVTWGSRRFRGKGSGKVNDEDEG